MLFKNRLREPHRPIGAKESFFEFLDVIEDFEPQRLLVEKLFANLSTDERLEYEKRLRALPQHSFDSAFFELVIRQALLNEGFTVESHPDLNSGKNTQPDFIVYKDRAPAFVLEAVLIEERIDDGDTQTSRAIKEQALNDLLAIESADFCVSVVPLNNTTIGTTPSVKEQRNKIAKWLESLDPKALLTSANYDSNPKLIIDIEGWRLQLTAIALERDSRKSIRGSTAYAGGWIGAGERIKNGLNRKAGKYGEFDLPYVIAANYLGYHGTLDDLKSALLGQKTYVIDRTNDGVGTYRQRNGLWNSGSSQQYKNVSGIWLFSKICVFSYFDGQHSLLLNPDATYPLNEDLPTNCLLPTQNECLTVYDCHRNGSRPLRSLSRK